MRMQISGSEAELKQNHIYTFAVWFHGLFNGIVLTFLGAKATLQFSRDWDYLTYHLPDALGRFGLTTYLPAPHLRVVNEAFPPLPHILQGLLILLTGRITSGNALNLLSLIAVSALLVKLFGRRVSWRWFFTGMLATPLVIFHIPSGYIDLFSNLWLLLSFAALLKIELSLSESKRFDTLTILCLFLGIGVGMLSKLQVWPTAAIVCCYFSFLMWRFTRLRLLSLPEALAFVFALSLLFAFWPVRNLITYGNPTYPAQFPFLSKIFSNHAMPAETPWNVPDYLLGKPHSLAFFHSALELNRLQEPETFNWSLDQWSRLNESSPHQRMGGWFYGTVLVLLISYGTAYFRNLVPRSWLIFLALSIVVTSAIPQSHELRYWLYIPFALSFLFAVSYSQFHQLTQLVLGIALFTCSAFVLRHTLSVDIDTRHPQAFAPLDAIEFWKTSQNNKALVSICNKMPETIYWSGPNFREILVEGCD